MARVSKKVSAAQREAESAPHRIWKTAIYARLSDFDDVLRDTELLEVQISYIDYYNNRRYQHRLFIQTPMQAHVSAMNRAA